MMPSLSLGLSLGSVPLMSRGGEVEPPAPTATADYAAIDIVANVDPHTWSASDRPTPIAGQRLYLLVLSEEQAPSAPSIGGSSTGVTRVDQINPAHWVTLYEKVGWESTDLAITVDYPASALFSALHGWRTVGWQYATGTLVAGGQLASNTTGTDLSITKAAGDITCVGTRRYETISATPAPTVDFNIFHGAARLMDPAAFSGTVACTTANGAAANKIAAAFNLTPL